MKKCLNCKNEHNKKGIFCCKSCASKHRGVSDNTRIAAKKAGIIRWQENREELIAKIWSPERRQLHSKRMQEVVRKHPESYSKNNVSGRVKMYEVSSPAGLTKVKGLWELAVAKELNLQNVKWTNSVKPFVYFWNGKWHQYFPDFYLEEIDSYIEVKGYHTERDDAKWSVVDRLLVLKKQDISRLSIVLSDYFNGRMAVS